MAISDFLAFATGGSANVETQATYAADPTTVNGFSAGVAASLKLNKVWRQSSFVSAGVAQFMLNRLNINILDDGNLSNFTANLTAALQSLTRIRLSANTAFFVSLTGSDSNDGLTSGTPWLTIQHAFNVLTSQYDLAGYTATIQLAHGVGYAPATLSQAFVGGTAVLSGDLSNYNLCTIAGGSISALLISNSAQIVLQGFTVGSSTNGITVQFGGVATINNINVGACGNYGITAQFGGIVYAVGANQIYSSGNCQALFYSYGGQIDLSAANMAFQSSPAFSTGLYVADALGSIFAGGVAYTGTGSGPGWIVGHNSYLNTTGQTGNITGAGFSAGSTNTGGQVS